jgi:hypothetical protein
VEQIASVRTSARSWTTPRSLIVLRSAASSLGDTGFGDRGVDRGPERRRLVIESGLLHGRHIGRAGERVLVVTANRKARRDRLHRGTVIRTEAWKKPPLLPSRPLKRLLPARTSSET